MPMKPQDIVNAVRDYFDTENWSYDYEENHEHPLIRTCAGIPGKLREISEVVEFRDTCFVVYGISPINADTDNLTEIAKYLTMANFNLDVGNFEMDVSDGEIRYKTFVDCEDLEALPYIIIWRAVATPFHRFTRFGNGIAALALGFSDAETEFEKATKKQEEPKTVE